MHGSKERRAGARAPYEVEVVLYLGSRRVRARAVDLSTTGMGLLVDEQVPLGTFVRSNFPLAGQDGKPRWFDVDGVVARLEQDAGKWHVGLQFAVLDSHAVQRINELVEAYRRSVALRKQAEVYTGRFGATRAASKREPGPGMPGGPAAAPVTGEYGKIGEEPPPAAATGTDGRRRTASTPKASPGPEGVTGSSQRELRALYRQAMRQLEVEERNGKKK